MEILETAIHRIDHDASAVRALPASGNEDLNNYLSQLLKKIADEDSSRRFRFVSADSEVRGKIADILDGGDFADCAVTIAERLLRKENSAEDLIAHLTHEIQKGVLFQVIFRIGGVKKLIISKADHIEVLDEENLRTLKGLPKKRKTYKAALIVFDEANEISNVSVYDTNPKIAKYWWDDFLELEEINTDVYNTETAFDAIDRKVLSKIKAAYPADHMVLRNRVIGYFRAADDFELEDFIANAVGNYLPAAPGFDIENFKNKIRELPAKQSFDSQFTIKREMITARQVKRVVALSDQIDLTIKDYVGNLSEVIKPELVDGIKYLRIRTDDGYDMFKTRPLV